MEKSILNTYSHCSFRIFYHIVFVTKYRRPALTDAMRDRLKELFGRICDNAKCVLVEMDGESDHVHLLVDASPNVQPSRLVNTLKTISSRELRKEFAVELARHYWKPVLWSRSYCVISAGGAPLDVVRKYIQNQGKDTD